MKATLATFFILAGSLAAATCPTITSTVTPPGCAPGNPHNPCAQPKCIVLDQVTVPCGCTGLATTTVTGKCTCRDGCGTQVEPIFLPCATTPAACPSMTETVTPRGCHLGRCITPECIRLETLDAPCSCATETPAPTVTVTGGCTCRGGCATDTNFHYQCSTTTPSPSPSSLTRRPPPHGSGCPPRPVQY